jgi:hypothetical protein
MTSTTLSSLAHPPRAARPARLLKHVIAVHLPSFPTSNLHQGLGKTLQTIAFLGHLRFERNSNVPSLVVCPLSVLSSWLNECEKW